MEEYLLKSIKEESRKFNFDDFFSSEDDLAALMVITSSDEYIVEIDVHEDAAIRIFEALYGEKLDIDDYFAFSFNDKGDVCIQLMNKDFIIVNIPDSLSDFQYKRLVYLNDIANNYLIELHTNIFDGDRHLSLDDFLKVIQPQSHYL